MKTSPLYSLDVKDIGKGCLIAIGSAVISSIEISLNAGSLNLNWKQIGLTALAAGLAYLGKNFFTSAKIIQNDETK